METRSNTHSLCLASLLQPFTDLERFSASLFKRLGSSESTTVCMWERAGPQVLWEMVIKCSKDEKVESTVRLRMAQGEMGDEVNISYCRWDQSVVGGGP